MKVKDIMSTPVRTCQPNTDLAEVATMMWEHDCGVIPVVDSLGTVVGLVTDRDICIASATRGLAPNRISAAAAMSADVKACLPDDGVSEALATMKHFRVRRLPVIDSHGILEGMVSMNDVARAANVNRSVSSRELVSTLAGICEHRTVGAA